jgi:hypothetical protein
MMTDRGITVPCFVSHEALTDKARGAGQGGMLSAVTDLLLRKAQTVRAGAQGDEDYEVIGPDGNVIGRIFKATRSRVGTPWMWILASGYREG